MNHYSVTGTQNAATGAEFSVVTVIGAAERAPKVGYIYCGCGETPADVQIKGEIRPFTAVGTATALVPTNTDMSGRAAKTTSGINHTAEPTYTAAKIFHAFALNQRSFFQFYCSETAKFIATLAANAGIGMVLVACTSGTPLMTGTMHFEE